MIFYKDTENRFIHVNKSLADTVGLSKEEVEGKSCMDIFHARRKVTGKTTRR